MPLRQAYAPMRPEFDDFLFAAVGEEVNGIPLSMISMLTQLGFDPWREAAHLASLARREAVEKLAQIIARLTGTRWPDDERAEIAGGLIKLLPPRASKTDGPATVRQPRTLKPGDWKNVLPDRSKLWLIGLIFGAAVLVSVVSSQGDALFGSHQPPVPPSAIEAPRN
jgi:hypothetical protein